MRAQIIKIEDNIVTVKTERGRQIKVSKKRINFVYHIKDYVVIEKKDDYISIRPEVLLSHKTQSKITSASEAQQKNEAEVERIMKERGIDRDYKPKKQFVSISPGLIVLLIICIVGTASIYTKGFGYFDKSSSKSSSSFTEDSKEMTEYKAEISALRECLSEISNEDIPIDDNEFWSKYIARYEATLGCYDAYPSPVSSLDRQAVETNLAKAKANSTTAEANNSAYRQTLADIETQCQANQRNYDDYMAELDRKAAENKAKTEEYFAEYDRKRTERDAEYARQQEEREAKQLACNNFEAEYPDVDTYREKVGNISALWSAYEVAKAEYDKWNGIAQHTDYSQHSANYSNSIASALSTAASKMNSAASAYNSAFSSLMYEYLDAHKATCQ